MFTLKRFLSVVVCCLVVSAGYMSYVIQERQSALRKVSRYNEAWTVSQTLGEYGRLEHRLASLGVEGSGATLEEVRLRLDFVFGRLEILEKGSLREFVGTDPAHARLLSELRATIEFVDKELNRTPLDIRPSLRRLALLDKPMTALAAAAATFGAARVQSDQDDLQTLHTIYTGLAGGLILCGLMLVLLLFQHNKLLVRAHAEMEGLTTDLQTTTAKLKAQNQQLDHVAHHDALTGLPNRIRFREQLESLLRSRSAGRRPGAILLLDLDGFKDVNDTLGHQTGDVLLQRVAGRLKSIVAENVAVYRLGGDEFAVVHESVEEAQALELAGSLIDLIAKPYTEQQQVITVGTSIGIAVIDNATSPDELLKRADFALYRAKDLGRGRACVFHTDMHSRFYETKAFEADLRNGLAKGEFSLHYQPQVDARTARVAGYEALLRWHHPQRGNIPPTQFIPVAEATGFIHELGEWALRTACKEASRWRPGSNSLAVNVSPLQLRNRQLPHIVSEALHESGLDPKQLELELTESALLEGDERTRASLAAIKSLGVRVAMDDFGTGYSSLGNLRRHPFDTIKIDKSFIAEIGPAQQSSAIVSLIIGVAKSLNMTIVAEGVETEDQYRSLVALGCDRMQGYLFGKPVAASALSEAVKIDQTLLLPASIRSQDKQQAKHRT